VTNAGLGLFDTAAGNYDAGGFVGRAVLHYFDKEVRIRWRRADGRCGGLTDGAAAHRQMH
jgi:hypothetical protein